VITTLLDDVTPNVVTLKVVLALPAGIVTLEGTDARLALLLESAIVAPPLGAVPESVTVPCELLPPVTLAGFRATEESPGVTVRVAV
jgi:hypothetical protein